MPNSSRTWAEEIHLVCCCTRVLPKIPLRQQLWKDSSFWVRVRLVVHVSEPYSRNERTTALYTVRFVGTDRDHHLLLKMGFLSIPKAWEALAMCCSMDPRYLKWLSASSWISPTCSGNCTSSPLPTTITLVFGTLTVRPHRSVTSKSFCIAWVIPTHDVMTTAMLSANWSSDQLLFHFRSWTNKMAVCPVQYHDCNLPTLPAPCFNNQVEE